MVASKTFRAKLFRMNSALNWVIVDIPFDVAKVWGLRGQPKVKGEINGFAFRTSLFSRKGGGHFLLVNKKMQRGAKAPPGSMARFSLEPDVEQRTLAVPVELKTIFAEEPSLRRWFEQLNYSQRKMFIDRIAESQSAAVRTRRAEQTAELLLATMEAERELPPIFEAVFAQTPGAREGWKKMSALQRRGHLMGIFYYQNPDSRARRLEKAIQDAVTLAEKRVSREKT